MIFDNREVAVGIWLIVAFVAVVSSKSLRGNLREVLRAAAHWKVLLPFAALMGYVAGEVWLGWRLGLWTIDLTKDTIIWSLTSAVALFVGFTTASKESRFFRRGLVSAAGAGLVFEYVVNFAPLALWAELLLQPVLFLLAMMLAVASSRREYRRVKVLVEIVLVGIIVYLLWHTVQTIRQDWATIDFLTTALEFALPIWLAIGLLPLIYTFALLSEYERAFLSFATDGLTPAQRRRARFAALIRLNVRARDARRLSPYWVRNAGQAADLRGAIGVMGKFVDRIHGEDNRERTYQRNLKKYAGVDGAGEDGKRLDRREFRETRRALSWISTCHMGRYDKGGRYQADLLSLWNDDFSSHGLPVPSGIKMRVSPHGQSWYAWRTTPSGWVFAIGSSGKAPSEWRYDGPEVPSDFPGKSPEWGQNVFDLGQARNWDD